MNQFEEERKYFPALRDWTYLDHCTSGLYPSYSHEKIQKYIDKGMNYGMTGRELEEYWEYTDEVRKETAKLFHCTEKEIMYGLSSTWLFNIFVNGLDLKPGDNVITSSTSHESVPYILLNKRQDGVEVRFADPVDGKTTPEDVFRLVDENTKAICLNHVEKIYGFRHDLKVYGDFCRERGIRFGVDASHSAGIMKIDVEEMGIDFLTCSGYKWLMTPLGIGIAYIRKSLQKELKLVDTGWASSVERWNKDVRNPRLFTDARRFECGGLSVLCLQAVTEVIKHYNALGADAVQEKSLSLTNYFYKRAEKELKSIHVLGNLPKGHRSNLVSVALPEGMYLTDAKLMEQGLRAHCFKNGSLIRMGFHYFNNTNDVDRMVEFLKKAEEEYRKKE